MNGRLSITARTCKQQCSQLLLAIITILIKRRKQCRTKQVSLILNRMLCVCFKHTPSSLGFRWLTSMITALLAVLCQLIRFRVCMQRVPKTPHDATHFSYYGTVGFKHCHSFSLSTVNSGTHSGVQTFMFFRSWSMTLSKKRPCSSLWVTLF